MVCMAWAIEAPVTSHNQSREKKSGRPVSLAPAVGAAAPARGDPHTSCIRVADAVFLFSASVDGGLRRVLRRERLEPP